MGIKATFGALLVAFGLVSGIAAAWAVPAAPLDDLVEVGGGELRWFGIEVYEARLLTGGGQYDGMAASGPQALEITYRRNISREQLVRTTEREWSRLSRELGLDSQIPVSGWLNELGAIWPDVVPGDRIIALVEPAGQTRFYGNESLLGSVEDPRFGPAFLGIWLHPETRAADLRARLIGERP
ncbi:MAG: chalcone isomerase family protein [Gammaproteobacteria bacterium]